MNLTKAKNLALLLMKKHNLYQKGWRFNYDNAKTRFGLCSWDRKSIQLSKINTLAETDENRIKNTILHEIAHALDFYKRGYSNHDKNWKKIAQSIGCCGSRCSSGETLNRKLLPKPKWKYTCPKCKFEYLRHKRSIREYSCGKCSPKWNKNYLLVETLNK